MRISLSSKKTVVITMGDPSGIGPEVTIKALASPKIKGLADFLVIGDGCVLSQTERRLGISLRCAFLDLRNVRRGRLCPGKPCALSGAAAIEYIDAAVALIKNQACRTLVTAPINKYAVHLAGFKNFQGHTEYLAEAFGIKNFAMMFVGENLKTVVVTRHLALRQACRSIDAKKIVRTVTLARDFLHDYFGIASPEIGIAGLNPHAGEGGMFGNEEKRIILPAVKAARKKYKGIRGPLPADSVFHDAVRGAFDCVIAMYHDQALIPFKLLYFENGVNLTLGLPFIRTSPDHGTAFDIAGKNEADPSSMIEAIRLSCRLPNR